MVVEALDTIAGSSAIDCDVIAARLSECLDSLSTNGPLYDALQNGDFKQEFGRPKCELEIEVRFGSIRNHLDGQKFNLPLSTDALVSERAHVKFAAGVSSSQYTAAHSFLKQLSEDYDSKSQWDANLNVLTYDRFFRLPEYEESVRISVPQNQTNSRDKSFLAIRKVKLATWNVYTGNFSKETQQNEETPMEAVSDQLDYRIAVNLEYRVPLREMPTTSTAKLCRKKSRDSYVHKKAGLRFDLSQVQVVDNDTVVKDNEPISHEVEMELMGETIIGVLMNDLLSHVDRVQLLKYHCSTLIRAVKHFRDVITKGDADSGNVDIMGSNIMTARLGLCDFRFVQQDEETIKRYRMVISPQLPLIGDYLFRAVTPALEKEKAKTQKRSPYREHVDEIPGPYIVVDDGPYKGKRVALGERL